MAAVLDAPPALDPRALRQTLGRFATGITVISARTEAGEEAAITANSFTSVSLEPPLVLFSMARTSKSFDAWEAAETFAVNILSEEQRALSSQFAKSSAEKWQDVSPVMAESGLPLLPGALGTFQCRTWARYDGGDHLIIVGEVFACAKAAEGKPLVFSASRYARLAEEA